MGTKKKEALIQFNKNNIIEAAKKLFESKGFETTTVDDIAKEADYSKSTVYVYFKSKDDILSAILLEHFKILRDTLKETIANEPDFEKCYELLCQDLINLHERYPLYFNRLLKEMKVTEQDFEAKNVNYEIYRVGEAINDQIGLFLTRGIEMGYLREDLAIVPTGLYLWSNISSTIIFAEEKKDYLLQRLKMSKEEYVSYSMRLIIDSIRRH